VRGPIPGGWWFALALAGAAVGCSSTQGAPDAGSAPDDGPAPEEAATEAGDPDGGCLPACILDLEASCAPVAAQSCVTQTSTPNRIDSCLDNGVKLDEVRPRQTLLMIQVKKPDGTLCYRETTNAGDQIFLDGAGNAVAEVRYDTTGGAVATCHDGTTATFRTDSAACLAAVAAAPTCTMGTCSF
jgi:hypothetical protein